MSADRPCVRLTRKELLANPAKAVELGQECEVEIVDEFGRSIGGLFDQRHPLQDPDVARLTAEVAELREKLRLAALNVHKVA